MLTRRDEFEPARTADEPGGAVGVRERSDIAADYKWRLEDIYASDERWDHDAAAVMALVHQLAALEGHLAESAARLLDALRLQDEIGKKIHHLYSYAFMRRDEDSANGVYQALLDRAGSLYVEVEQVKAFLLPEILSLPEAQIRQWLDDNVDLALYRFAIDELLRMKPHVLSASEEQLLASAGKVAMGPEHIFSMFQNADMRFPTVTDDEGRVVELTHGRYGQLLHSRNRAVRQEAYETYHNTYAKHRNSLAAMFAASVDKDAFYARARRYSSAREAALDADNIPLTVYDSLIDAVHEALPILHKYLELRKKVLGLDTLHMYDLYTPIVAEGDQKWPYDEAIATVLDAVKPLGEEYASVASEGMSSGWTDVYETRGKSSGAYSQGVYGVHPYMLLNHQDTLEDMFTAAHELGHAMHSYYSHRTQPFVYADYTIFVAEVASTCNEALLVDHLLQTTSDPAKRALVLNHYLEGFRTTLFRQTMFAEFERTVHQQVEAGASLTADWLSETYYALNQRYMGAEVDVDRTVEIEWARIPHFYSAFYVYKYATGWAAATALADKILHEGDDAVGAYIEFLSSGGSAHSIDLLRRAGVDMESTEPVKAALRQFARGVDEMAALLAP